MMMISKILSKKNEYDKILLSLVCCIITLLSANIAKATIGDVYAQGTIYNAATYSSHPSYFGHSDKLNVVDLNVGSGSADCNVPIYAPEPGGTVTKIYINNSGWGNAITWTKGSESIFIAHLSAFENHGSVDGGEVIGYVGSTGNSTSCHLHIESNQGRLVLSGDQIIPEYWYNGPPYTSGGPSTGAGVTVFEFWRRSDPIYASNQNGQDNFDAQYKIRNDGSGSITIDDMAIAILKDGAFLFDCWLKNSSTIISGSGTYQTGIHYCEIYNSGSYSTEARLKINGEWHPAYESLSFTVLSQQSTLPDLIVQSPSVNDASLTPGQLFIIYATVKNQGSGSSNSTTLRYYRSTNSIISASDTQLGTDPVSGLSPNGTSSENITVSAPATDDTYWVGACVDAVSGESPTDNQCSAGVQITVTKPTAGTPSSITVPSSDSDGSYTVSWGASSTSSVSYVLEEATNSNFSSGLRTAYSGSSTNTTITGRSSGSTYYYRVKAIRSGYTDSSWRTGLNGCSVTIAQNNNNWPMFHHDTANTGSSPDTGVPPQVEMIWQYYCRGGYSPAIVDGRVYFGASNMSGDDVIALDAGNGSLIWSYNFGGNAYVDATAPTVVNGSVYVTGSEDSNSNGKVYSFDATSGNVNWSYTIGDYIFKSSPKVIDGKVYFGASDNKVYSLDADNGSLLWTYTAGSNVSSTPAVAAGVVYIGSNDHKLYALNADTGNLIWSYDTDLDGYNGSIQNAPAVYEGKVYFRSGNDYTYCLNANNGSVVWKRQTDGGQNSIAIANGIAFIGDYSGSIYGLNADNGNIVWSYATGTQIASSPVIANGVLYIVIGGDNDADLVALNALNGSLLWNIDIGNRSFISSVPAIADGRIFVSDKDSYLYAFGTAPPDTTSPDTSITGGPSGTITYKDVTFTCSGSDDVTSTSNLVYSYKLDGYDSGWSSYVSSTSRSYSDLSNGPYTFYVKAKDEAENIDSSPASRSFTVNYTAPDNTAPVVSAGDDKTESTAFTQTATATDANVMTYVWSKHSGPGAVTFGAPNALSTTIWASADGTYAIRFTATDAAGNSAFDDMSLLWDTEAPTVAIGNPSVTVTKGGPVTYTVTYTGAATITLTALNVTLNKTGTANGTVNVNGTGNTTRTVSISGITGDGTLSISMAAGTASDNAGNLSDASRAGETFTVDNTAPVTTANPPAGTYGSAQNVTMSANEQVTIYYTTNGTDPTEGSTIYSGPISIAETTTLKYFAKDTVGNVETVKSQTYTIDASLNGIPGDMDGDDAVTLADAIIALQVMVGMQPQGLREDYATSGADVNGDDRVGMAEVLYILQKAAGMV